MYRRLTVCYYRLLDRQASNYSSDSNLSQKLFLHSPIYLNHVHLRRHDHHHAAQFDWTINCLPHRASYNTTATTSFYLTSSLSFLGWC
jgi:hypothetical protein